MKIRKLRRIVDFEATEKWLNDMATEGMHLVDYGFNLYTFKSGEPGKYIYRIILLDGKSQVEIIRFMRFLEESGVEHIASGAFGSIAIVRKSASDGPFEIFTDKESLIKQYKIMASAGIWSLAVIVPLFAAQIWAIFLANQLWGIINVFVAIFLAITFVQVSRGLARVTQKIKWLKAEQELHE